MNFLLKMVECRLDFLSPSVLNHGFLERGAPG